MKGNPDIPEPSRRSERARLELSRLDPNAPLDRVFVRACELSAIALAVERVGVWLFIDDQSVLRCANLYERSKGEHSSGAVLRVADFPTYFKSLVIRKAIPSEVAATAPWTAELAEAYLRPLGITSVLDAGIFVDGTLVGVVCHEHVGPPREWSTEDRDFAGSVADLLAMRIQSAHVRELREAFQTQRERLAALDKSAALAQLAAGVAHDFKNVLTIVLGHGELISQRSDVPQDVREQARAIIDAAERGTALARELVEFARPTNNPPTVLDLANVAGEILPVLRAAVGPRHSVRFICPHALGQVLIGKTDFTRIMLNLVINAAEAMPKGGAIDVRLLPVRRGDGPVGSGRFVLLEVIDTGSGMDEVTRRRVFDPFFTTKDRGTGLGLAIVRQAVERAGGMIRVESTPGHGTTFQVFLPRIGASSGGTAVHPVLSSMLRGEGE